MELDQLIRSEMQSLIEDLRAKHIELGMKASTEWLQALEQTVTVSDVKAVSTILGAAYTEQLVQGRRPGRRPPVDPLKDWVRIKFGLIDDKEIDSAAFAIATKIGREGTSYFPQGTDLIDGVITDERVRSITNRVGAFITRQSSERMVRQLQAA